MTADRPRLRCRFCGTCAYRACSCSGRCWVVARCAPSSACRARSVLAAVCSCSLGMFASSLSGRVAPLSRRAPARLDRRQMTMTNHSAPMPPASRQGPRALASAAGYACPRAARLAAIASGALGGLLLIAQAWLLARVVDAVVIRGPGLERSGPGSGPPRRFRAPRRSSARRRCHRLRGRRPRRAQTPRHIARPASPRSARPGPGGAHRRGRQHGCRRGREHRPLLRRLPAPDGAGRLRPARHPGLRRPDGLGLGADHVRLGAADPALHGADRQGRRSVEPGANGASSPA